MKASFLMNGKCDADNILILSQSKLSHKHLMSHKKNRWIEVTTTHGEESMGYRNYHNSIKLHTLCEMRPADKCWALCLRRNQLLANPGQEFITDIPSPAGLLLL